MQRFYCEECISKRISDHLGDLHRIGAARNVAESNAEKYLGAQTSVEQIIEDGYSSDRDQRAALLDPFAHGGENSGGGVFRFETEQDEQLQIAAAPVSHTYRTARAAKYNFEAQIEAFGAQERNSREEKAVLRARIKAKREEIMTRRANLKKLGARELVVGEEEDGAEEKHAFDGPGAWPTSRVMQTKEARKGIQARVKATKELIRELEKESRHIVQELQT